MINIYKQPKSANTYVNLFIQEISDNVENVCLLFIGHLETIYNILVAKPGVNFTVIDGGDTTEALPYIYNGANLKESITFKDSWCKDNDTFIEGLHSIFDNMPFDLIIANPPYGKSSSLSKKIVNKMLECKVAKDYVVLAPPKTFVDLYENVESWKGYYGWENTRMFEGAALENLCIVAVKQAKVNKFESYLDCILEPKMKQLRNAVIEYNKTHDIFYDFKGWSTLQTKEKGILDNIDENLIFLVPIFTPSNLNGVAFAGESYKHNVLKENIVYEKRHSGPWNMVLHSQLEYINFSKWWYGSGKRREKSLLNLGFDTLYRAYGGDPSLNKYCEVIPNLDWSKPWTDAEILAEIGLPEDFLEKE